MAHANLRQRYTLRATRTHPLAPFHSECSSTGVRFNSSFGFFSVVFKTHNTFCHTLKSTIWATPKSCGVSWPLLTLQKENTPSHSTVLWNMSIQTTIWKWAKKNSVCSGCKHWRTWRSSGWNFISAEQTVVNNDYAPPVPHARVRSKILRFVSTNRNVRITNLYSLKWDASYFILYIYSCACERHETRSGSHLQYVIAAINGRPVTSADAGDSLRKGYINVSL